ncbi:poly [ADP-ribose] polymerase 1 [Lepeophtheirus salmonis]|uniref:poly [ADP-ribose] polymerase 1 n=1 Tax=Lepeophtheirus salmonis TaxID=72036 RepID=UPI001AE3E344|nr:poly [ADP-ribose] polymerase 1-like [Lepeophtheirus salmonis]
MGDADASSLPYLGEYAKSGRASCKKCKITIEKGVLRLAIMVQSPMFDGKVPHWHHAKCFFTKARPHTVGEIGHFDDLRWEDQEKLRELVKDALAGKIPGTKGKGQSKNGTIGKDFRIEYSKSGGAKCNVCEEKIKKGLVRVSKKEYQSERALRYGPYDAWNHLKCFAQKQEELGYFDSGDSLDGFKTLSQDDQKEVKSLIKKLESIKRKIKEENGPESKKIKVDPEEEKIKGDIKNQMKKLYYYRDNLSKLKKKELDYIQEHNCQDIISGLEPTLDRIADGMTFGALNRCSECSNGQLAFKGSNGYQCTGDISEWTRCVYKTHEPERTPFKIPQEFREEYSWFQLYKGSVKKRIIPIGEDIKVLPTKVEKDRAARVIKTPFKDLKFFLEGSVDKKSIEKQIKDLGGRVSSRISANTAAIIADSSSVGKMTDNIEKAKSLQIQVIPPESLDKAMKIDPETLIKQHSICEWGSEPSSRIPHLKKVSSSGSSNSGSKANSTSKSVKLTLKGGGCVDPDSGLDNKCHVFKKGDTLYSSVLGAVSVQDGKNSYYKLQILKHDKKNHRYYLFRSWGRVGTTIGGKKTEDFDSSSDAIREFERLYEEKTGNLWRHRNKFEKLPGKFYPLDIDFGSSQSDAESKKLVLSESKSKLALPIKELISLIFDVESMKKALVEFEIDLNKMPLGKLSRKQIEKAYSILNEAQNLLDSKTQSQSKVIDATNRFFTLIPHDFGMNSPPLLEDLELIKNKIEMLDNLLEIEVAYSLLQSDSSSQENGDIDPFDSYYKKLNTELEVVDNSSEEYQILEKYVQNTHAATHDMYSLEIESILKVNRKGENKKFKPFRKLPNRRLLWHGSRMTNFVGILSQGLKIAPPEAPVTGYMFGKGIYFADMVSKSANYCHTSKKKNTGLLMLCDVALGNIYEKTSAEYVEKLPPGKHSTMGIGKTQPDPNDVTEIDGSTIQYGKSVKDDNLKSDLLYNEFIVYDVAQVQCKYLFRMKFNYKI